MKITKPHLKDIKRLRNPEGDRVKYVRLDKNERTVPFPASVWKEMMDGFDPEQLTVYPEMNELIAKIARWVGLKPDQIYLTSGSDLAIKACFEAFVAPADEVVYLAPTFAMVEVYGRLFQAAMKKVQTGDDLKVDVKAMIAVISDKTSFVVLANPNSPAGTSFSRHDMELLIAHCDKLGCPILVDEAYYYFHKETVIDLVDRYPCLVVCRTFSKACGLAGVRLGFAAADKNTLEFLSKWRPMYEVNTFAVHIGKYIIDHPGLIDDYVRQVDQAKEMLYRWGEERAVPVYQSAANFVNIKIGKKNVQPVVDACTKINVMVRGAGPFVLNDDCIRISFGTVEQAKPILGIMEEVLGLKVSPR